MRNHYRTLGLAADADRQEILDACDDLDQVEDEEAAEIVSVLTNRNRRSGYDAMHHQYSVLGEVFALLEPDVSDFNDSNHWDRRLVEFMPDTQVSD